MKRSAGQAEESLVIGWNDNPGALPAAASIPPGDDASHGSGPSLDASMEIIGRYLAEAGGSGAYLVRGPIRASAAADMERILEFRSSQYEGRRDYLYGEEQREIERRLELDWRSDHFIAECGDRVVGSLRLTPAPFEFEALHVSWARLAPMLAGHVELSRLVVHPAAGREKVMPGLVIAACHWALKAGYAGVAALCGPASHAIFRHYGLSPIAGASHCVPWRSAEPYWLMAAQWPELIANSARISGRLSARARRNGEDRRGEG